MSTKQFRRGWSRNPQGFSPFRSPSVFAATLHLHNSATEVNSLASNQAIRVLRELPIGLGTNHGETNIIECGRRRGRTAGD
jgi:hypothetical protein